LLYLFRDESVEATEAYQLGAVSTLIKNNAAESQRVLQRFPIDGIAVPWDVRPPAALSPDHKQLVMVQWDEEIGRILLVDTTTGKDHTISQYQVRGLFSPTILGWLPDGSGFLVYEENQLPGIVSRYTLTDSTTTQLFTIPDVSAQSGLETLSPNGQWLIYCTSAAPRGCNGFAMRSMTDGIHAPITINIPKGTVCPGYPALKWSADSTRVALGCLNLRDASIQVITAGTGVARAYPMEFEIGDFEWSPDQTTLLVDWCAGNYVNVDDPDCGALRLLNLVSGAITLGPAIERTEARRLFWLQDTIILNQSTGGGQEATMYFYDIPTRQSKQFTRNASTYADASFTVMALRPAG
jgi:hypothetical protein